MSNKHFAAVPNISIPRSRFKQEMNHATTMFHGDLVPIDCFEVIAGDTFNLKLSSMVWMSTPIAPIFGNIKMYFKAYFVPMRLVWTHWQEFFGENRTSAGYQQSSYQVPNASVFSASIGASSLSHYLGKPITTANNSKINYGKASVLKERGFYTIWNEYYRPQQVTSPVIVDVSDNGNIGTYNGSALTFATNCFKVFKEFDYFTAATVSPQYGAAVSLPMGTFAPVISTNDEHSIQNVAAHLVNSNNGNDATPNLVLATAPATAGHTYLASESSGIGSTINQSLTFNNLWADLSTATAATVNQLRYAFAVQKYLERANFGSRYFEILAVHYGVTSPDSRLQIPERLGSAVMDININTVLSTAGADSSSSTKLGQPGAVSSSALRKKSLFTKAFVEPGYVFILASTHHERSYTQGLLREDTKFDKYDFYSPEFANLGDQEIKLKEIYLQGSSADENTFGYQEHWAEYRYRPDRVSGLLDPVAANGLDYWTLADKFTAAPNLSTAFLTENRDMLARALVTGSTGPDYICDFYFDYTATREMPIITIPGLIDHFGSM